MQYPEKVQEFAKFLKDVMSVNHSHTPAAEKWDHLRKAIQKSAFATFGWKTSKNCDWFEAMSREMTPVIKAKRVAFPEYKRSANEKSPNHLELLETNCKKMHHRLLTGAQ